MADLGGGGGTVTSSASGAATLTLTPSGGPTAFSGVLEDGSGTVAVVLSGAGTQVFSRQQHLQRRHDPAERRALRQPRLQPGCLHRASTLSSGTFRASGGFTLSSSRAVTVGAATVEVDSGTLIYGGAIAEATPGSGSLTKIGAGVLQLDGNNTFTGATSIQAGALAGIGTLASTITISGSADLAPGDSGPGTLTLAGLTLANHSIVDLTSAAAATWWSSAAR